MSPRSLPGISQKPDYGALYQPSETDLVSPQRIYQTAGFVSILKCLKHSKHMLAAIDTGQCLFEYLRQAPAQQSRVHLPASVGVPLMDDEFEDAAADPRKILNPSPTNISSKHRRDLLNSEVPHPKKRIDDFVWEMRVIGWVLQSLRNMRLAWLLRSAPLPLNYVRLIRRPDFDWLEPLLPVARRLPSDIGSTGSQIRRLAGSPSSKGFMRAHLKHASVSQRREDRRKSSVLPPTINLQNTQENGDEAKQRKPSSLPKWTDLVIGTEGGDKVAGRPEGAPPPWQSVARQERRQRRILKLERRSTATGAVRLLEQLKQTCAESRERLFHIYDHRVQLMDVERRQRLAHKYLSIQTAECTERALRNTRAEVKQRMLADLPAVIPARWYKLLQKRATDLGCDDEIMMEFDERLGPFITEELSSFSSAAERLCMLVMSLPVFELMLPRWQRGLLFVLVEVLQHHEGLLQGWLQCRHYPDDVLHPSGGAPTQAA